MSNPHATDGTDNLPFGERRRETRAETAVAGKMIVSGDERDCRVRNLSPLGLRADGGGLPQPGERVFIEIPGLARAAAVAIWRIGSGCGLRFEDRQDVQFALGGLQVPPI